MASKVYVVMGSTGEYSANCEWPVFAFRAEASAQALVIAAETWLREQGIHDDNMTRSLSYADRDALRNPHDPYMQSPDYTGTRYFIMEVDFDA
jgi:hypothetical protein